ncbi:MAG TPA: hypothetical protein VG937_04080 [Polyangiaceae bacterium]|nr:hypothetical protein [Polyangiaceae bacterium]
MLVSTGCIVADPPQYEEPKRTPPILDLNHAEPSPFWLVIIDRNDGQLNHALQVTVPFRSDDQGEWVWFALHVDFKGQDVPLWSDRRPPSTIDDTTRSMSRPSEMDARVGAGCHQLTLIAAHESSWDITNQRPLPDAPKDDIAIGTWWVHMDPKSDPYTLPSCPNQSEVDKK